MNTFSKISLLLISLWTPGSLAAQQQQILSEQGKKDVARIVQTLADDDMRGRSALTKDIEKAADFISGEMRRIGLVPYAESDYRQSFDLDKISLLSNQAFLNGKALPTDHIIALGSTLDINWNNDSGITLQYIKPEDDFSTAFRNFSKATENTIVFVDSTFADYFKRFGKMLSGPRFAENSNPAPSIVYILTDAPANAPFAIQVKKKGKSFRCSMSPGFYRARAKPMSMLFSPDTTIISAYYLH